MFQWLGSLIYVTTKQKYLTDIHIMHDQVLARRLRSLWAARAAQSPNKQDVEVSQAERASIKRERTSRAFQRTVLCARDTSGLKNTQGTRLTSRTADGTKMEQKLEHKRRCSMEQAQCSMEQAR